MANHYLHLEADISINMNSSAFNFSTSSFTLTFWIRTTLNNDLIAINTQGFTGWTIRLDNNKILLIFDDEINSGSGVDIVSNQSVNTGEWVHVAFVCYLRTASSGFNSDCTLYINGEEDEHSSLPDIHDISASNARFITNAVSGYDVDDIRSYKGTMLSEAEIQDIYNSEDGKKIIATEPNLSWGSNCDTGEGANVIDVLGGNSGTVVLYSFPATYEPYTEAWREGGKGLFTVKNFQDIYVQIAEATAFSKDLLASTVDSLGDSDNYDNTGKKGSVRVIVDTVSTPGESWNEETINPILFEKELITSANSAWQQMGDLSLSNTPYSSIVVALNKFTIKYVLSTATTTAGSGGNYSDNLQDFIDNDCNWNDPSGNAPDSWLTLTSLSGFNIT